MNKELNEVTARALFECLKMATGLPVKRTAHGAEIQIGGCWCSCEADFDNIAETEDGVMAAAYVRVVLNKDTIIEDLIVGMGEYVGDACLSAIQQFVSGIVIPVVTISNKISPKHSMHAKQATISKINYRGLNWTVALGQVASNDATGQLYQVLDQYPPIDIVWHTLQQKMAVPRPHWAKLYLCRYPDGSMDGEVVIDNRCDEQALQGLLSFVWPTKQELIWFRQFCFIEPAGFRQIIAPSRSMNPFQWFAGNPFS